jgi:hypothetical protein
MEWYRLFGSIVPDISRKAVYSAWRLAQYVIQFINIHNQFLQKEGYCPHLHTLAISSAAARHPTGQLLQAAHAQQCHHT